MNIIIRRCDACHERHDSSQREFSGYGVFEDITGQRYDVCPGCSQRLFAPLTGAQGTPQE